jgi:predicted enzyme related to lactoylglutathione lyase
MRKPLEQESLMGTGHPSGVGKIHWVDLTVGNADDVKHFYRGVVGWESSEVEMGDYRDYTMKTPDDGQEVAGICHARGVNVDLPSQWLIYITVRDVDRSAARCVELGGQVIAGPKQIGKHGRYCVIQDPAGAVAALFQPSEV